MSAPIIFWPGQRVLAGAGLSSASGLLRHRVTTSPTSASASFQRSSTKAVLHNVALDCGARYHNRGAAERRANFHELADAALPRAPLQVVKPPASPRRQPPAAQLPPSTWMVVPVTKRGQVGGEEDAPRRRRRRRARARQRRPRPRRSPMPGVGMTSGAMQFTRIMPLAELERQALGEVLDRRLHRRVDREARPGAVRLDRGDVDDRAAALRHQRHRRRG